MGDVLTKDEAFSLALTTARLADSPGLVSEEESRLAGAVTRLVAEVERLRAELLHQLKHDPPHIFIDDATNLRARNEALERVAKAATAIKWDDASEYEGRFDASLYISCDCLHDMKDALSALNDGSGGVT